MAPHPDLAHQVAITLEANRAIDEPRGRAGGRQVDEYPRRMFQPFVVKCDFAVELDRHADRIGQNGSANVLDGGKPGRPFHLRRGTRRPGGR